jgi:RimJ/RimL family protein N-acetyltransferase
MKIELRDPVAGDVPVFFAHQQEAEALRMASFPSRDLAAFGAHWDKTAGDPTVLRKTIVADGRVAGYVASFERAGLREVCYWFGKNFWSRGVATRALELFLGVEARRPLRARVAKSNPASVRVVEKCGFKVAAEETYTNGAGEEVAEFVLKLEAPTTK